MAGRVFLVEDEVLVAMTIENILEELDYSIVETATRFSDAVVKARTVEADVALLDIDLSGNYSFPVADILHHRNIPFSFTTGHGAVPFPPSLHQAPRLLKPFSYDQLRLVMSLLMYRGGKYG